MSAANEFDHPLVAASYDIVDGPRDDLALYREIVREVGARSVLDVGCGTGELAISLAALGLDVIGLDPAAAMLDVARRKAGADVVSWVHGDVSVLATAAVEAGGAAHAEPGADAGLDLAVMTGNVAQVFIDDAAWLGALRGIRTALRPGGMLVFETRIPQRRAWQGWADDAVPDRYHLPSVGEVVETFELVRVAEPLVTFRSHMQLPDGTVHTAESTLIFRSMAEIERTLAEAGFTVTEVKDAPDRPDREWVILASSS